MYKLIKHSSREISVIIDNIEVSFIKDSGKIWLTKKELSKVFGVSKKIIKEKYSTIEVLNSDCTNNYNKIFLINSKEKKYYSIDSIILLGYNLKKYNRVKFLVTLNRYIKFCYKDETTLDRIKSGLVRNFSIIKENFLV